jgi:hypothetical protein
MQADLDPMLEALRRMPSLDVSVEELEAARGPTRANALISIRSPAGTSTYVAEVKRNVTTSTLAAIANQLGRQSQHFDRPPLLLAPYLTPGVTEQLVDKGIEFADSTGNVFLAGPAAYVLVLGKQPERGLGPGAGSGLTATSLKLIYALLVAPQLWRATYRDLREATGVSLGKISSTLGHLEKSGYVFRSPNGTLSPIEPSELHARWEYGYLEQLRPTLKPSGWVLHANDRMPDLLGRVDARSNALIGGEYAASIQTGYLNPTTIALHVPPGASKETAVGLRLRPADEGATVTLLERFVPVGKGRTAQQAALDQSTGADANLAHPVLVRVELLAHDDPRLRKTADRLLEDVIRPQLAAHARA